MFYINAWTRMFNFSGTESRINYILFAITNGCIGWSLYLLQMQELADISLYYVYTGLSFIPAVAYAIRRLHDSGASGWWVLAPIVNLYWLLGKHEDSKYDGQPVLYELAISKVK